jgi:threonine aldolase
MLVGAKSFIEKARSVRKMMGGGMRQAGVIAAAGLIALEKMPSRLIEDHENARLLAGLLSESPKLGVEPEKVCTNIFMVDIARTGLDSGELVGRLKKAGVLVSALDSARLRMVTHRDVNREQIIRAAELIKDCVAQRS